MRRTVVGTIAAIVAATCAVPPVGSAPVPKWYWTESHAERAALAKVKIPCKRIYGRTDPRRCDVAAAQAALDAATDPAAAESCQQKFDSTAQMNCLAFLAQSASRASAWLSNAKNGYALETAECVGSQERGDTFTFARFRCAISTKPDRVYGGFARGHIALYPTGRVTFRWEII